MIDEKIARKAVDLLNEMLIMDRVATTKLCFDRVFCNEKLANHPTIQVSSSKTGQGYTVGLLGVLNGLAGSNDTDGWGCIAADFNKEKFEAGELYIDRFFIMEEKLG